MPAQWLVLLLNATLVTRGIIDHDKLAKFSPDTDWLSVYIQHFKMIVAANNISDDKKV